MNNFLETAAPCCFGIVFFLLLFGFIAFMRYMGYRETLALAEKGLVKPERRSGNGTLFWGIGFTAVGAALLLGLWPIGFIAGERFPLGLGPWLLFGLLPMFFGLGLMLFYVLTRDSKPVEKLTPAPILVPVTAPVVTPVVMQEPISLIPPSEQPVPPTPSTPPEPPSNLTP